MKKTHPFWLCCVLLLFPFRIFGQSPTNYNNFDLKKLLPTSPEAAMLGRFGDVPIGHYTGTADVSVPLYNIRVGGFEIPIVLRYHGSGIKVEDEASNVGLGWSLDPGGAIIKIINGKEDVYDNLVNTDGYNVLRNRNPAAPQVTAPLEQGIFANRQSEGNAFFSNCYSYPNGTEDTYSTLFALEQGMGQPDIYQYSFPGGYSGKFFINPETGNLVLLDKDKDISFSQISGGWQAKTLDGNTFYFTTVESVTQGSAYPSSPAQGITYKLTKIVLHNGRIITFNYQDGFYQWFSYSETFHTEYPLNLGNGTDNTVMWSPNGNNHYIKMLSSIVSDNETINFNFESRVDLYTVGSATPAKRIGSMDIRSTLGNNLLKSFQFSYDYFNAGIDGGDFLSKVASNASAFSTANSKRLKLLSVQENGYTSGGGLVSKPPHFFSYDDSAPLPLKTSFSRDFWGYYNGQNNDKLLPDLSFFYYSGDPVYGAMTTDIITRYQGANRSPDSTKMKLGLLKKIKYPTGGSTEFDYSPHKFGNFAYPDITQLRNASVNVNVSDHNYPGNPTAYTFSINVAQSVIFNNIITRGPNAAMTFFDIQPSTITLTKVEGGVTYTVKTWQMFYPADHATFESNGGTMQWTEAINLTPGQYTLTTFLPDGLGEQSSFPNYASVSSNISYKSMPLNVLTNTYGGGMRIASLRNYDSGGQLINKKVIKYLNVDNSSSGILMTPLKSLYAEMMYATKSSGSGSQTNSGGRSMVWYVSSESVVPFSNAAQGNMIGYSRVEELDVAPSGLPNGRKVNTYHNLASEYRINLPENPHPLNGKIKTEEFFDNLSNTPLKKIIYNYSLLQSAKLNCYKAFPTFIGDGDIGCASVLENGVSVPVINYRYKFMISIYPLNSYWYALGSKETQESLSGNLITIVENYLYNAKGQLVNSAFTNSKSQVISTEFAYPSDNATDQTALLLIQQGLYDHVQKITNKVNGTIRDQTRFTYRMENNVMVGDSILKLFNGGAPVLEVYFNKYGANKSIVEVTQMGVKSSLKWGYNNLYPVAEIKNASSTEFYSEGFEDSGAGIVGSAHTGTKYSTETAVSWARPNTRSYIISYWCRNGSAWNLKKDNYPANSYTLTGGDAYDDICIYPVDAMITTYALMPSVGLTSSTDPKGMTTYYEYDDFQRLKNIKDQNGNIVKSYDYHYKP